MWKVEYRLLTKLRGFSVAAVAVHLHPGGFISPVQTQLQRENQPLLGTVGLLIAPLELKLIGCHSRSHYFTHPARELCMNMYVREAEVITYARFHHA